MKYKFSFLIACLSVSFFAEAQNDFDQKAEEYIHQFKDIAIAQQVKSGVPAAITLAQGILETSAGCSELCQKANKHFGIKCKSNWTGETYAYTDDAQNECFRKYADAQRSFEDHSRFLRNNPRYASLFSLNPINYKAWAKGLKRCGYATNPVYAAKLIGYIEKYNLEAFTDLALKEKGGSQKEVALSREEQPVQVKNASFQNMGFDPQSRGDKGSKDSAGHVREYYKTTERNGLKGFYAPKGDLLLEYAIRHRIRYSRLLDWNDLQDRPLPADLFIYLEAKRKKGLRKTHVVQPGETLLQISQEEGIQLVQLRVYNKLPEEEEPVAGETLFLAGPNPIPPQVYKKAAVNKPEKQVYASKGQADDYVTTEPEKEDRLTGLSEQAHEVPSHTATEEDEAVAPHVAENKRTFPQQARSGESALANKNRRSSPVVQKVPKPAASPKEESSPLAKLKAYMDKVVYATPANEKEAEPSAPAHTISAGPKPVITTLPARKTAVKPSSLHKAASTGRFYTVQKGDTAFGIAEKYKISLRQLKEWNHLPKSMTVNKGQKLRVAP
jgi:LysM repeat protein